MTNAPPSIVAELARVLEASGVDLGALGLAWGRAMPVVAIVPAFGLRAVPQPARVVIALALAASVFPAVAPEARADAATPWALLLALQVARGVPIAIAAAVPLWAATMAGGVVDAVRGAEGTVAIAAVEGKPTLLGAPFALLASCIFFATGGPSRVAAVLAAAAPLARAPILAAAHDLSGGITIALALAAPLVAAALVLEVGAALVARAATPAQVHALVLPWRGLALLGLTAVVFDRIAAVLAAAVYSGIR